MHKAADSGSLGVSGLGSAVPTFRTVPLPSSRNVSKSRSKFAIQGWTPFSRHWGGGGCAAPTDHLKIILPHHAVAALPAACG